MRSKGEILRQTAFVATLDPNMSVWQLASKAVTKGPSREERLQAAMHLATQPFGVYGQLWRDHLHNKYYDATNLPLSEDSQPKLIGAGGESFVFLITSENLPHQVLKVDRFSLGLSLDEQIVRTNQLRAKHEELKARFSDIEGFIMPITLFIGRLPYRNQRGIGTLQPYIEDVYDLFEDFTDSDLSSIFYRQPNLIKELDFFMQEHERMNTAGKYLDLVGRNNLALRGVRLNYQLTFMDSCDIRTGKTNNRIFDQKIKRLQSLIRNNNS